MSNFNYTVQHLDFRMTLLNDELENVINACGLFEDTIQEFDMRDRWKAEN
jgi:hypothetical protein